MTPPLTNFSCSFLAAAACSSRDVAVLDHLRQHAVARFFGAVHVALGGGIAIGCANDAGEESGFAEGELAHVLAEIGLGGFAKSADGKTAAIAQINFVGIQLENLLLGKALVDFDRHQNFFYLAAPFALGGEEKAARHLHIDGAGALGFLAAAKVGEGRANTRTQSSPPCSKKRLSSAASTASTRSRKIVKADDAALFARAVKKIGDQLRLDFGGIARGAVGKLRDARDLPRGEIDAKRVHSAKIGIGGRAEFRPSFRRSYTAPGAPSASAFLISRAEEIGGQVPGVQGFPDVDHVRSGKNPRSILKNLAGKPLVNQAAELNVVVSEERGAGEQHRAEPRPGARNRRGRSRSPARFESEIAIIFHQSAHVKRSLRKRKAGFGRRAAANASPPPSEWIPILNRAVVRVVMKSRVNL